MNEECSNCSHPQTPMKTNKNEGASSLYHPEILEKPAARPGPGHGPATPPTGPGASPDRHFFSGWIDYHGCCSIAIVLPLSHRSHSPSSPGSYSYTPKVCPPPQPETFHHHETVSQHRNKFRPVLVAWSWPRGGVTFWVTPSFFCKLAWVAVPAGVRLGGRWRPLWCVGCPCVGLVPFMFPWGSAFRIMWVCDGSVCSPFPFLSFPCGGVFSCGSRCGFMYMVWVISWCFVHVCAWCQEAPLGWFPSWSLQAYH